MSDAMNRFLYGSPKKHSGPIKTHQITREQFEALSDEAQEWTRLFVMSSDVPALQDAYQRTGNGLHAWQAWRLVQAVDAQTPAWLIEFVSASAQKIATARNASEAAAAAGFPHGQSDTEKQLSDSMLLLRRYLNELDRMDTRHPDRPKSKEEIYRRLASEFGTTEGAMKKKLLALVR